MGLLPEIWRRIFRWATFVPNAFDRDVPRSIFVPPPLSQDEIQEGIRRSLKTKRDLVLVCKLWKDLATFFLYEAVYVGFGQDVVQIAISNPCRLEVRRIGGREESHAYDEETGFCL